MNKQQPSNIVARIAKADMRKHAFSKEHLDVCVEKAVGDSTEPPAAANRYLVDKYL